MQTQHQVCLASYGSLSLILSLFHPVSPPSSIPYSPSFFPFSCFPSLFPFLFLSISCIRSLFLSTYPSIYICTYLCICLSMYLSACVSLSADMFVICLLGCLPISGFVYLGDCQFVCLMLEQAFGLICLHILILYWCNQFRLCISSFNLPIIITL